MKKIVCTLLSLMIALIALPALAEDTVQVILNADATQAFTDEAMMVLLIGHVDAELEAMTSASVHHVLEEKVRFAKSCPIQKAPCLRKNGKQGAFLPVRDIKSPGTRLPCPQPRW